MPARTHVLFIDLSDKRLALLDGVVGRANESQPDVFATVGIGKEEVVLIVGRDQDLWSMSTVTMADPWHWFEFN